MFLSRLAVSMMGVAGFAGAVLAVDTVTARFDSVSPGGAGCTVAYSGFGPENTVAGQLNFSNASGAISDLGTAFGGFCCDIPKNVNYGGTYTWTKTQLRNAPTPAGASDFNPMGIVKEAQIQELWGRFHGTLGSNDTRTAAFQLAIWAIIYGNGNTPNGPSVSVLSVSGDLATSGTFSASISNSVAEQASDWLSQLNGDANYRDLNVYALSGGEGGPQDQIVPTPGSLSLCGLGGLVMARRRRR